MAEHSSIEWTDATWNPVTGCSVVSPGCTNCYAMRLAGGRLQHHPSRAGLTTPSKAGPVWNGQVRLNEAMLTDPLRWTRPRRIFVCAHGDLFHEAVPDAWIDQVFAVMALAPHHTFQVLTKRAYRMRAYIRDLLMLRRSVYVAALDVTGHGQTPKITYAFTGLPDHEVGPWRPLPNVWLGVSAEDQARADERIPDLLATPAAVRFLSAEPLLGPIDLAGMLWRDSVGLTHRGVLPDKAEPDDFEYWTKHAGIRWVIAGGESGPGARPMHPAWARRIRDDCAAAGVPFHFKQHGAWVHEPGMAHLRSMGVDFSWKRVDSQLEGVRPAFMVLKTKKAAGRLLDGVEHNGFPKRQPA